MRLKGIHLAMRSGMLAAEDGVRRGARRRHVGGGAVGATRRWSTRAPIKTELYPVRNVHQAFGDGLVRGQRRSPAWRWSPAGAWLAGPARPARPQADAA